MLSEGPNPDDGNGPTSSVNAGISAISLLFKHLCEKQITHRNPTIGVKRPKINGKKVKAPVLTPAQF
jgi:hypothetical protein